MENQNYHDEEEKFPPILSPFEKKGLFFVIALLIFLPIVLTQFSSFIVFDQSSGVIGDTIGGITAPIIGIGAAWVVYRSFEAQMMANRYLQTQHKVQMDEIRREQSNIQLRSLIDMIFKDFEERENQEKGWVLVLLEELKSLMYYKQNGKPRNIPGVGNTNTNLIVPIERITTSIESFLTIYDEIVGHERNFKKDHKSRYNIYVLSRAREVLSVANYKSLSTMNLDNSDLEYLDPGHRDSLEYLIDRFHELEQKIGPIPMNLSMNNFFVF